MMWGYGQGMGWMWLWVPLLLIGIALLVLEVVRGTGGGMRSGFGPGGPDLSGPPQTTGGNRAREILDERLARGELTADQYRELLRVLSEGR
jgi:putative membrane protein